MRQSNARKKAERRVLKNSQKKATYLKGLQLKNQRDAQKMKEGQVWW